jgi:hypothetical protein
MLKVEKNQQFFLLPSLLADMVINLLYPLLYMVMAKVGKIKLIFEIKNLLSS